MPKQLKNCIHGAKLKATLAVNGEIIVLSWEIEREILKHQQQEGDGTKVVDQLARDLEKEFPG